MAEGTSFDVNKREAAVVSRLRRRLRMASADVRIETRRGIGYRLVPGREVAVHEMS